LFVNK